MVLLFLDRNEFCAKSQEFFLSGPRLELPLLFKPSLVATIMRIRVTVIKGKGQLESRFGRVSNKQLIGFCIILIKQLI